MPKRIRQNYRGARAMSKRVREYWKPKVGDWAEFAFHPGETRKLLRSWVFIRAKVYGGYIVTWTGSPNIWFAMRHQLRAIPVPTPRPKRGRK